MYGTKNGIDMYRRTHVTTADPLKLVVMCYEGAVKNMKTAREKHLSGEFEAKGKAILKVHNILGLLMQSLDFEKGGEVARNLNDLYIYMQRRITEGDLKRDLKVFDEVISMLEELASGWKENDSPRPNRITSSEAARPGEEGVGIAGAY